MRSPIYRNLDKPFELMGFNTLELIALLFIFVAGSELADILTLSRIWVFIFTTLLALSLYSFRRFLGEMFFRRLIRFVVLPKEIWPRLIKWGGSP